MKITRRDFLKYCISSAAVLGLDLSTLGKLSKALAENSGPHVLWLSAASCTGCTVSLANLISTSAPKDIADLLINVINLDFQPNLMGASGDLAVQSLRNIAKGNYILAVDGCIPSAFDGKACILWNENGTDVTALSAVRDLASHSIANLSIGTCASFGGMCSASPNPTQAIPLSTAIGKPTINIPGCPTHPDWIVYVVAQLLAGNIPALDSSGRPIALFGGESKNVHERCPRREMEEAETYGMANLCLEELGCKGPRTQGDCPIRKWNNKLSFCMNANANCLGCTENGFPDKFVPFFKVSTTSTIPLQKALAVNLAVWDTTNLVLNVAGTGKIGAQAVIKNTSGGLISATMIKRNGTWSISKAGLASVPTSILVFSNGASVSANVTNSPGGKLFAISSAVYTTATNRITVLGTGPAGSTVAINVAGGALLGAVTIATDGTWKLDMISPIPVPQSISALCNGVTLTATVQGAPVPKAFMISSAIYNSTTKQLSIAGTAPAGGKVTVFSSSGAKLGTPAANSSGNWSLVITNPVPVPKTVKAIYNGKTLTATVQIISVPPSATLRITEAKWEREKGKLNVKGKGTAGATVRIYNALSKALLGSITILKGGEWEMVKYNIKYVSRVSAVSNGRSVEANVKID